MATRREYTAEFKREAVRLAEERGNKSAVARELGIHMSMLRRWKHELQDNGQQAFPGKGNPHDEELARIRRELKRVEEENAILKRLWVSSRAALTEVPIYRRAPRAVLRHGHGPRLLQVSTSGDYAWRRRPFAFPSASHEADEKLLSEIKTIHVESKRRYGSPRIHKQLRQRGIRCGQKRVARLMREHGLRARRHRRFKATTDSRHTLPVAENVLERQFKAEVPDARWAADITYIWTQQGWLYLAVVMDLFSRRIVGWSMQETME